MILHLSLNWKTTLKRNSIYQGLGLASALARLILTNDINNNIIKIIYDIT